MYTLKTTTQFKKDLKKYKNNTNAISSLEVIINKLMIEGVDGIPSKNKPHKLKGNYNDNWECHILPDLLIIWIQVENPSTIKLVRIGSHSELFK